MEALQQFTRLFKIHSWLVAVVGWGVRKVLGWLERNAPQKFENIIKSTSYDVRVRVTQAHRRPERRVYFESPESGHQSHYPVWAVQQSVLRAFSEPRRDDVPRWASEIEPFLANQLSGHTRRAYETDLKQFFKFIHQSVDLTDVSSITPHTIIIFRKALEEGRVTGKPMSKASINRKLAVVKSFLNWLKANQMIGDNPAQLVKGFPQSQESSLQGLSDEEVVRVLDKPNRSSKSGSLHYAVLHCLFFLGIRKSELIDLKLGDFDTVRGVPVVKVRGKGHKVRILPITDTVKYAIDLYLRHNGRDRTQKEAPLFTPTKNPRFGVLFKPLNPNAITYIVQKYAKEAGILKNISPHSCRATCISNALDKKASHRSVQALAGWSSPLMIQRYDKRKEDLQNSAAFVIDYGESKKERSGSV